MFQLSCLFTLNTCNKDLHRFVETTMFHNMVGRCSSSIQHCLSNMELVLAGDSTELVGCICVLASCVRCAVLPGFPLAA